MRVYVCAPTCVLVSARACFCLCVCVCVYVCVCVWQREREKVPSQIQRAKWDHTSPTSTNAQSFTTVYTYMYVCSSVVGVFECEWRGGGAFLFCAQRVSEQTRSCLQTTQTVPFSNFMINKMTGSQSFHNDYSWNEEKEEEEKTFVRQMQQYIFFHNWAAISSFSIHYDSPNIQSWKIRILDWW